MGYTWTCFILFYRNLMYNSFSHKFGFCARSAFSSNSPARMRHSVRINTPLSSRARALWRSFFLPFYRPTHSLCACLSACWDIYDMSHSIRTFLLFLEYWKGRWKQHQSSDCHIQVLTDHFWGCVGGFYEIMPHLPRQSSQLCEFY